MKTMIAVIAVFFSIAIQAQDVFDKNSTPEQREQELMNFIKNQRYRSGNQPFLRSDNEQYSILRYNIIQIKIFMGA